METVRLSIQSINGQVMWFQIKIATRFERVKQIFAQKIGMPLHEVRFLFAGRSIQDEDTPTSCNMIDGDNIKCYPIDYQLQDAPQNFVQNQPEFLGKFF